MNTIVIDVMYDASVGTIPINDTAFITVKELIELMGWRARIRMAVHQGYMAGGVM